MESPNSHESSRRRLSSTSSISPPDSSKATRKRSRKNSTRACDTCKVRKIRCDGTQPCARCTRFHGDCTYESKYTRGSHVSPMRSIGTQTDPIAPYVFNSASGDADDQGDMNGIDCTFQEQDARSGEISRSSTPDSQEKPFLTGSASLLYPHNAQHRRPHSFAVYNSNGSQPAQISQKSHSQDLWFNDSSMGEVYSNVLALPSKQLALQLAAWYFDNACPTYRILHRPLVEHWIKAGFHAEPSPFDVDFPKRYANPRSAEEAQIRKGLLTDKCISALVFTVWAMGCQFPVGLRRDDSCQREILQQRSKQYFLIAQSELKTDSNPPDLLIKLQAQFIMAAWDLLVTVKNIATDLDLNRRDTFRRRTQDKSRDRLPPELKKRVFWAIYTLETYMCTMLGKTLTWSEEDITVEYPAVVRHALLQQVSDTDGNDAADALATMDVDHTRALSIMYSPIAHAKICHIVRRALRKLYRDVPSDRHEEKIDELVSSVEEWEESLPAFLRLEYPADGLRLPYSRQVDIIHLARAHALILILRPSLNLCAEPFEQVSQEKEISPRKRAQQDKCLEVAMSVAEMGDFTNLSGSNWFIAYVAFCAVTVMFVYLSHYPRATNRQLILHRARKLCDVEMSLTGESDMAKRYVSALKELWHQVRKSLRVVNDPCTLQNQKTDSALTAHQTAAELSDPRQEKPDLNRAIKQPESGLWTFDLWDSGLTEAEYSVPNPALLSDFSKAEGLFGGTLPDRVDTMEEFNRFIFGDLLESLAQSFQGFDSTASGGFGR